MLVNTYDLHGGAARAVYRLNQGLQHRGVESKLIVKSKTSDDPTVIQASPKRLSKLQKLVPIFRNRHLKQLMKGTEIPSRFSVSPDEVIGMDLHREINTFKPDVVHINWICNDFVSLNDIARIDLPVVWTFHDSWPFTGGCHIPFQCKGYASRCGKCPLLNSQYEHDLSRWIFECKTKCFSPLNLTIVTPSRWMAQSAGRSLIFKNRRIEVIHNGLDTSIFRPVDRVTARNLLGLPQDKKLILFGAIDCASDSNKGFTYLKQAVQKLASDGWEKKAELVVFGAPVTAVPQTFGLITHHMGRIHDDLKLVLIYSAADVMVVPSLQESFGQTASEAMACGIPVAAFACTGLLDIVDHGINGYLANPYDATDLATCICSILDHDHPFDLSVQARDKVIKEFSLDVICRKYKNLYTQLINGKPSFYE